jgi:arylsulfatase A-like enzyme
MIMTDDVAPYDISAIHRGIGAVSTPNIDRLAREGLTINDYYAQPSCTAGRAAFITGQYPIRTGLTSVGQPGAPLGLKADDVTLAELLKARGYATGQFGKSHVGDRNEHLPTVHGFDEFFGLLYHLNVMEQFEQPEFRKTPTSRVVRATCSTPGPPTRTTPPKIRASARSASSASNTAARWAPSAWRPSMTRSSPPPPTG